MDVLHKNSNKRLVTLHAGGDFCARFEMGFSHCLLGTAIVVMDPELF